MLVQVSGGKPMKRSLKQPYTAKWTCKCPKTHPSYLVACPRCREKRTA